MGILDGMPAGLTLDLERINEELSRRQQGYGRGNRQKIEKDTIEIIGGVRHGITTGAPIAFLVRNRDFDNWRHVMSVEPVDLTDAEVIAQLEKKSIGQFRPGHADLPGAIKFRQKDIRDVLERASARETATRVAAGAICLQLLQNLGIEVACHVVQVGSIKAANLADEMPLAEVERRAVASDLFCLDEESCQSMKELIKEMWQDGDSLGGIVEVLADGLPVGLGSYTQWDRRLDGQLAQALLGTQAIKAVEIGDGVEAASKPGSQVHDAIYPANSGSKLPFKRKTNRAGGIEGGMTNGERICVRAYMKPIPTMRRGLDSLSFPDYKASKAHYERSDVCAIAAASVVCKAMVCLVLANAVVDKFASDNIIDLKASLSEYQEFCRSPQSIDGAFAPNSTKSETQGQEEPQGNEDAVGEF
jgi:chorismate synthase